MRRHSVAKAVRGAMSGIITASKKPVVLDGFGFSGGPAVFAGNHVAYEDTMLTIVSLVKLGIHVRPLVALDGLTPFEKVLLEKICEVIWVDRVDNGEEGRAVRRKAMSESIGALAGGGNVMIRPSAIYSPYLDKEPPYFAGAARMAIETGARLVPFVQEYGEGGRFYLELLPPLDVRGMSPYQATEALHGIIENGRPALREKHGIHLTPEQYAAMWARSQAHPAGVSNCTSGYKFMRGYRQAPAECEAWWRGGEAVRSAPRDP